MATRKAVERTPRVFNVAYEQTPRALNVATHSVTRTYAENPFHPFHIRTKRKLAAFNPHRLHILVIAPTTLSRKALIRAVAVRRLRHCIAEQLREAGFNWDGTVIDTAETEKEEEESEQRQNLAGAYRISLVSDAIAINAKRKVIQASCAWLVERMIANQMQSAGNDVNGRANGGRNGKPNGYGKRETPLRENVDADPS